MICLPAKACVSTSFFLKEETVASLLFHRWHSMRRICRGEFIKIAEPEKPAASGRQQAKRRREGDKKPQQSRTVKLKDLFSASSEKSQER